MPNLTESQLAQWNDSRQPEIIATAVIALLLGNVAVVLRYWGQWRIYHRLFWEDCALFAALALTNFTICCYAAAVHYGLGLHQYRLGIEKPADLIYIYKYRLWGAASNLPGVYFIKTTLLLFYKRIFLINQPWAKALWYTIFVYNTLWVLGGTLFLAIQCWPVSYFWNRLYSQLKVPTTRHYSGKCWPATPVTATIPMILGLVSDFATLLLPVLFISKLHQSWKKKIALLALFGFGLLACTLELARVVVFLVRTDDLNDTSYGVCEVAILTYSAEVVGIMCACLPMIAALIRSYRRPMTKTPTPQVVDTSVPKSQPPHKNRLLSFGRSRTRETDSALLSHDTYLYASSISAKLPSMRSGEKNREVLEMSPHQARDS